MATKDKLVNLEDLKIVNDDLQGKVGSIKSAIASSDVFETIDSSVQEDGNYYITSEGSKHNSASWKAYIIRYPIGIKSINAKLGTNNASYIGIAFYSDFNVSSTSYISGVAFGNGEISATVPDGAFMIVITTRPASFADYYAYISKSIDGDIEKISQLIPYEDWEYGTLDANGYRYATFALRTRSLYHLHVGDIITFTPPTGVDLRWNMELYDADENIITTSFVYKTTTGVVIQSETYARFFMRVNGVDSRIDRSYCTSLAVYSLYARDEIRYKPDQIAQRAIYSHEKIGFPAEYVGMFDVDGHSLACDCCFVNDELWIFNASTDDDPTSLVGYYRYVYDATENRFAYVCGGKHNLGHVNSIEYNKFNDCLICGNGSGDYTLENKVFIVPNASQLQNNEDIDTRVNCIVIDCSSALLGTKLNVVWGGQNYGRNDLCYFITNDNGVVRLVQLGKGSNDLGSGTIISGVGDNAFNGTYKILSTHKQSDYGYETCVQGASYYNGILYCGIGHSTGGDLVWGMELCTDGTIRRTAYKEVYSSASGEIFGSVAGLTFHDGYMYVEDGGYLLKYKLY